MLRDKMTYKYDRVLNMRQDAITEGFWISQDSGYGRFLRMQALHTVLVNWVLKIVNMPWVMRVLNMPE